MLNNRMKGAYYHTYQAKLASRANVMALIGQLDAAGIETRPLWKPMHQQPLYKDVPYYGQAEPVSENLFRAGLCLPSGPRVSEEDVRYICDMIHESLEA